MQLLLLSLLILAVRQSLCARKAGQDLEKYVAASTEDLARLFQLEKDFWTILQKYRDNDATKKDEASLELFLARTCFDKISSEDNLQHVSNPVNAFHTLKRTTGLWEEILRKMEKQIKLKKAKQILRKFPERSDFEEGAAFGLMTIQMYYNISYHDMMSGHTQKINRYESTSTPHLPLDWRDAVMISRVANLVRRLDKQIEWLTTAIEYCHEDNGNLVRELERNVMEHDDVLLKHGLGHITDQTPDGLPEVPVFTFSKPVGPIKTSEIYEKSVTKSKMEASIIKIGQNIKPLESPTQTTFLTQTFHRMWYYGQNTTIALCQGQNLMNAEIERKLISIHLHHNNPYLALGPFKYEERSKDPHIGIFRDFYSDKECNGIIRRAKGNIKSTGYQVADKVKYYTSQRVSKRITIGEKDFRLAQKSSERISLATRWIVHQVKALHCWND